MVSGHGRRGSRQPRSYCGAVWRAHAPLQAKVSRDADAFTVAPMSSTSRWSFSAVRCEVDANAMCSSTCAVPGTTSNRLPALNASESDATPWPVSVDTTRRPLLRVVLCGALTARGADGAASGTLQSRARAMRGRHAKVGANSKTPSAVESGDGARADVMRRAARDTAPLARRTPETPH